MATAHISEMGIVFRRLNPLQQTPAWWDSVLNDLKAHHVPSLQKAGERLTTDGHHGIMYFTSSTVTADEAIPILKKHGVEVYDVRGEDEEK